LSVKEAGIEIEALELETAAHGGAAFIRKFNGSGT
jgi:hypothetical protein